jgi:hypothetical protein
MNYYELNLKKSPICNVAMVFMEYDKFKLLFIHTHNDEFIGY